MRYSGPFDRQENYQAPQVPRANSHLFRQNHSLLVEFGCLVRMVLTPFDPLEFPSEHSFGCLVELRCDRSAPDPYYVRELFAGLEAPSGLRVLDRVCARYSLLPRYGREGAFVFVAQVDFITRPELRLGYDLEATCEVLRRRPPNSPFEVIHDFRLRRSQRRAPNHWGPTPLGARPRVFADRRPLEVEIAGSYVHPPRAIHRVPGRAGQLTVQRAFQCLRPLRPVPEPLADLLGTARAVVDPDDCSALALGFAAEEQEGFGFNPNPNPGAGADG